MHNHAGGEGIKVPFSSSLGGRVMLAAQPFFLLQTISGSGHMHDISGPGRLHLAGGGLCGRLPPPLGHRQAVMPTAGEHGEPCCSCAACHA